MPLINVIDLKLPPFYASKLLNIKLLSKIKLFPFYDKTITYKILKKKKLIPPPF